MNAKNYTGYLADHVGLIRSLHEGGASTQAIAVALFEIGVRAQSSNPYRNELTRAEHLKNLQAMTIYIERRLGLRTRRYRILNMKVGGGRDEPRRANSKMLMSEERSAIDEIATGT